MMARQITSLFFFCLLFCLLFLTVPAQTKSPAQSIAVIAADKEPLTRDLADLLAASLETSFRLADADLVGAVIDSSAGKNLFNLSLEEAKNIGAGIGSDYYVILRGENLRRSSSKKPVYYEAYSVAFLVNARTGDLVSWKHLSAEADTPDAAAKDLLLLFGRYAGAMPSAMTNSGANSGPATAIDPGVYEINEDSDRSLRTPLPFRRFSPASTTLAQYLRIEAVVDIQVAIDEKGYITQTRIARFAGFGLDEAVTETVRKMNFRPAILNGKPIPVRFLLRYNFRLPPIDKKS